MRKKLLYFIVALSACAAITLLPWFAFQEARHQAFAEEAKLTLAYARDARYRADEIGFQADKALKLLSRSGATPCSAEARVLMHQIHLTSPYLQGIGFVRDDTLICSSFGDIPTRLGHMSFRTSAGDQLYLDVPVEHDARSALMAVERGGIAVLLHRDLPLATWATKSGVSVAIIHLERPEGASSAISRGHIDTAWVRRLGADRETTFAANGYLVAIVRSRRIPSVAVAAIPIASVHERAQAIALRIVPAGLVVGLILAAVILLLVRRQMSVASALRYALRNNEFYLVYQPLVDLVSGKCVGVEALLRMRRGTGEMIGPDLFIPIAEQTGLITRLTERVISLIEQDAGNFLVRHPTFHVAINISSADLKSDELLLLIDRFLERTGTRASNLIIEITERGFIDLAIAQRALAAFRARGIEVAVDDFGTGYSSLSYLESLDLDLLKIDRSFIESIGTAAPTSQVVGHIIAMARALGLRMIAEGIETEEQADFVRRHGVEYAQGWLFGKPVAFTEIEQMVDAQSASNDSPHAVHSGCST